MNVFSRNPKNPILEKVSCDIGILLEFLLDFQMNIHWNFLDFHRINSKISYILLWIYEKNPIKIPHDNVSKFLFVSIVGLSDFWRTAPPDSLRPTTIRINPINVNNLPITTIVATKIKGKIPGRLSVNKNKEIYLLLSLLIFLLWEAINLFGYCFSYLHRFPTYK